MSRERELTDQQAELEPDFETPGRQLKRAREKAGVKLQAIGRELHMSTHKLEALEQDQYEKLPAEVFVQGYLRRYAKLVGLDEEAIIESFNQYLAQLRATTEPITQVEETQQRPEAFQPPQWLMPAVVFGVAVLVLGTVIWLTAVDDPATDTTTPSPSVSEAPLPPPPSAEEPEEPAVADTEDQPADGAPEPAETADSVSASDESAVPETSDTPPASSSSATGELRFEFTSDCWVKVIDATGEVIHARLETAGGDLTLEGQAPFEVMLGNARAVDLIYNGRNVPITIQPGFDTAKITVGDSSPQSTVDGQQ